MNCSEFISFLRNVIQQVSVEQTWHGLCFFCSSVKLKVRQWLYTREEDVVEHIQSKLQHELELRSAPAVAAASKVILGMEL